VLKHILAHTVDLDIENCMFVILDQLVDMLKVDMPTTLRETLTRCAKDREKVCNTDLMTDLTRGKQVLTVVMNGGAAPEEMTPNAFLSNVQQLSRYMRWLACGLLPRVHQACQQDAARPRPESSTFYYWWTAIEDIILTSWLGCLEKHNFAHVSLHYDGVRVSRPLPCDVVELCDECAKHILAETGFNVHIREKKHLNFMERVSLRSTTKGTPTPWMRSSCAREIASRPRWLISSLLLML